MKKYLKIIIPILVLGALVFMGYQVVSKINHKNAVAQNIKTIPKFAYKTIDGKPFSNQHLKNNTATIFIYFNSTCYYCQHKAEQIKSNIEKLKQVQLVFISEEIAENIKAFATTYKLLEHDNINFLCDTQASFATTFDANSLPILVVYDKNKQLIEKIKGQVKIEKIISLLTPKVKT